ncbi:MAG: hypothetical protein HC872_00745 [Gammaproteobacteria bacterium]|nr:hypothetical protein [Gammaproteobacteria bacterium]
MERYVRRSSQDKLIAAPGEKFAYSNNAYEVLGDLIAKHVPEIANTETNDTGQVIAQNPTVFARFAGGLPARHLRERAASGRFANMTLLEAEFGELGPIAGKLDAAAIMFIWHDAMALDAAGRASLCRDLYEAMRPGAPLLFADHAGSGTAQDTALHRVGREVALAELQACGFRLEAQSDLLRNPADDHARSIFDKDLRGRTDRFVMRFVRP